MTITDEINRSVPIRRAFIWDRIIQLGFSPRTDINKKSWILLFKQNLLSFWGNESQPVYETRHSATVIRVTYPGLTYDDEVVFECRISNDFQFSVDVLQGDNIWWVHEYDQKYYSPSFDVFLPFISGRTRGASPLNTTLGRDDIEAVIDGLILHPCVHQHIRYPVYRHEIRLGGGITNPYVYLFHLRYQLCPDERRRENERLRLTELFFNAINDNRLEVAPNDLMTVP